MAPVEMVMFSIYREYVLVDVEVVGNKYWVGLV